MLGKQKSIEMIELKPAKREPPAARSIIGENGPQLVQEIQENNAIAIHLYPPESGAGERSCLYSIR
jgi:hypothetical protein